MRAAGGVHRRGTGARRRTMALVLAGLVVAAGTSANATTTPSDQGGNGEDGAPVDDGGAGAPADNGNDSGSGSGSGTGGGDGADQDDSGAAPAAPAPAPLAPGLSLVDGFIAGGHGTSPATFSPLLGDADHPVPEPPVNKNLPEEVDELGPFVRQVSCDPADQPGITAFAMLVFSHYDRPAYSSSRPCVGYMSFHHDGRALDWSVSAYDAMDRRIGDSAVLWLTENDGEMAARFGIENIIWNFQIWDRWSGWQHYAGAPHDDHVHFAFTFDGAQARTSWWTGVAVSRPDLGPCASPDGYASPHVFLRVDACDPVTGAAPDLGQPEGGLAAVQEMLGVEVTEVLDEDTRAGLIAWQMDAELPVTGVADTWTIAAIEDREADPVPEELQAALPQPWEVTEFTPYRRTTLEEGATGEAVTLLQTAIGAEPDGKFGPLTAEALLEWEDTVPVLAAQAKVRGDGPVAVTPLTWMVLERAVHPTIAVRGVELSEGSRDQVADPEGMRLTPPVAEPATDASSPHAGGAVTMLQQLLDVEVDGDYGPLTADAVREVQKAAGLEPTGAVDGPTWAAVEAAAVEAELVPGPPGLAAQRAREKAEAKQKAAEEQAAETAAQEQAAEAAAFEDSLVGADR